MTLDRLEWHLGNWANWMKNSTNKLYYPSKSSIFKSGGDSTIDVFEIMCEDSDMHCAKTLDALIDSLPSNQSCAIHHIWLHAVYKMRDLEQSYDAAIEKLLILANKRGLT